MDFREWLRQASEEFVFWRRNQVNDAMHLSEEFSCKLLKNNEDHYWNRRMMRSRR
jgi:hypothetical protein